MPIYSAMNQHPQSPDSGTPGSDDSEPMSLEEFREWHKQDPAAAEQCLEQITEIVRKAQGTDFGEKTEEMRELTKVILSKHAAREKLKKLHAKIEELMSVMQRPAGSMLAEDRLAQCRQKVEEAVDLALELPEPHRTIFMKELVPFRDGFRAMRVPEG